MILIVWSIGSENGTHDFKKFIFDVIQNKHFRFSFLDFLMVVHSKSLDMLHNRTRGKMEQFSHSRCAEPRGTRPLSKRGSAGPFVRTNAEIIGELSMVERPGFSFSNDDGVCSQEKTDARN